MQKEKEALKTYIRQADATKRLLKRTNNHGANAKRIDDIEAKIKRAQNQLKLLG